VLSTLLLFPMVPAFVLAGVLLFQLVPERLRSRVRPGWELALVFPLVGLAALASGVLGPLVERVAFGGDFKIWLSDTAGLTYDARNCLVVGFAMGFAVVPIVFTISEDALSSVPESLKAASLALGASLWQTAVRVVLPTASPGIFSAAMVGLGRAVGETMIVLMATGNTPIWDLSIFNGMRALSANIAVEIPEAPHGGTLYRILFLSALLLFLLTFVVNTVAELLRLRLRRKYSVV
jgi:phosphate transport system permease protein